MIQQLTAMATQLDLARANDLKTVELSIVVSRQEALRIIAHGSAADYVAYCSGLEQ